MSLAQHVAHFAAEHRALTERLDELDELAAVLPTMEAELEALKSSVAEKEQAIAQMRAAGNDTFADMLTGMDVTPGQGIDFSALHRVLLIMVALPKHCLFSLCQLVVTMNEQGQMRGLPEPQT